MDIELWKQRKKELKLTFEDLSVQTGLSVRTLKSLFTGERSNTTTFTIQAIEKALGLENADANVPAEIQELINSIAKLQPSEIEEISNYVDFVVSKRK
jgi:transcriptional regulator with XRE-family HTH domain